MNYKIYSYDRYFDAVRQNASEARNRIHIEGMTLDDGERMSPIFDVLAKPAVGGLSRRIIFDRYAYLTSLDLGISGPTRLKKRLSQLATSGVDIVQVGAMRPNIFSGRHHPKVTIIDDTVFSFGGINPQSVRDAPHDFMLRTENQALADHLWNTRHGSALNRGVSSSYHISETDTVLVDGGEKGESLIYDAACELADRCEKILFLSKLSASGRLADILKQRQTTYVTNRLKTANGADKAAIVLSRLVDGPYSNSYKNDGNIHAKCIVGQAANGDLEAITGSHNYSHLGVKYGTQELALHTRDQQLCELLLAHIDSEIAPGTNFRSGNA